MKSKPEEFVLGLTLIEVLVSLVILGTGMLGMMALQASSLRSNQNAFYRTHAAFLASGIVEKMRSNKLALEQGEYNKPDGAAAYDEVRHCGNFNESPASQCSASEQAAFDLALWNRELAEILPLGKGVVCLDSTPGDLPVASTDDPGTCEVAGGAGNSVYAVKIWWDTDRSGSVDLNFEMAAKL